MGYIPLRYNIGCMALYSKSVYRRRSHTFDIPHSGLMSYRAVRWAVYLFFAFICLAFSGEQGQFIYFQF